MKKISPLHTSLVVLLVGIIVLGFYMTGKNNSTPEVHKTQTGSDSAGSGTDSLYEAEQKQLQDKMDAYALYNSAVDNLDITACEKIAGNDQLKAECSDNVYSAQASKDKNAALCEKIQNIATRAHCSNGFVYDTALASGKQSDCGKIIGDSDLKNACMKNVVFAKLEDRSFSGTTDVCETLAGADKEYCVGRIKKSGDIDLLQKGTTTKDVNACAQIQDMNMRNTCGDTVYMTLALENKNGSLCAKIVDTGRKDSCTTQFARLSDATSLQDALAQNNLALCSRIITPDMRTKCMDTILLKQ